MNTLWPQSQFSLKSLKINGCILLFMLLLKTPSEFNLKKWNTNGKWFTLHSSFFFFSGTKRNLAFIYRDIADPFSESIKLSTGLGCMHDFEPRPTRLIDDPCPGSTFFVNNHVWWTIGNPYFVHFLKYVISQSETWQSLWCIYWKELHSSMLVPNLCRAYGKWYRNTLLGGFKFLSLVTSAFFERQS